MWLFTLCSITAGYCALQNRSNIPIYFDTLHFFSSPEHNVLVSFSDRSLSVVRTYVNNCLKNISSETTRSISMKHHRKLLWVTLYKNTTRRHDWPTTTKCLTSCFALKNIFSEIISLKLMGQIQWNFMHGKLTLPSTKMHWSWLIISSFVKLFQIMSFVNSKFL